MSYPPDYFDGEPRAPRVVRETETIEGTHQGAVYVEPGGKLTLAGTHQGSLHVQTQARVIITGSHQGSLHVDADAEVTIRGRQQGSLHISGRVTVEEGATCAGSVHNHGVFVVSGRQGGRITGDGRTDIRPTAEIVQPVRRGGSDVYEWRE